MPCIFIGLYPPEKRTFTPVEGPVTELSKTLKPADKHREQEPTPSLLNDRAGNVEGMKKRITLMLTMVLLAPGARAESPSPARGKSLGTLPSSGFVPSIPSRARQQAMPGMVSKIADPS